MRILYFSRDYTPHDHRFLSALARTEHQVYFLRLEHRGRQLEDRPLPPEIEQIRWRGGKAPATLSQGPSLLYSLRKVIQQVKPDLIHAGPIQRSAFLAALSGFRPLVSMSWGYDLIQDAQRNAWQRWATRFTLQRSAMLVGDCNTIRKIAISFGMPDERIVTFPWGIDLAHFSPINHQSTQELRTPSEESPGAQDGKRRPFTLLSTRSWEPIYGVDVLARAFVLAARECADLHLVMLGNGSQAGLLQQIFRQAGLPGEPIAGLGAERIPRVVFPGQVGYANLPRYYQSADLYLAATHSDGTSISLLEAMACGCPVLVSDIDGNREWVTPDSNGWLFPDGDEHALANAMLKAAAMRQHLSQMGASARKVVEERADWQKNFPKLLDVYNQVYHQT